MAEIIEKIYSLQVLLGTTGDPFDSWLATFWKVIS